MFSGQEMKIIKTRNKHNNEVNTSYFINDQEIKNVRSFGFCDYPDEIPIFVFETMGFPEANALGNLVFSFSPTTIHDATIVLRNELMKHGDLYNGFFASIKSALDDCGYERCCLDDANSEVAYEILRRIIGEE